MCAFPNVVISNGVYTHLQDSIFSPKSLISLQPLFERLNLEVDWVHRIEILGSGKQEFAATLGHLELNLVGF